MPVQKGKSPVLAKLGNVIEKAFQEHKAAPVEHSQIGDLPAGLNGRAQLVECKFDLVKPGKELSGQPFFYAAGIVLEPEEFTDDKGNVHRVAGLRTNITEMLCETKGRVRESVGDHTKWVLNQLKLLGAPIEQLNSWGEVEQICEELKKQKPIFAFRTWKGQKQTTGKYKDKEPQTMHFWDGVVENGSTNEPDPTAGAEDNSGGNTGGEPQTDTSPADDLEALAEVAMNGEGEEMETAQSRLATLAIELGISEDAITNAESYGAVKEMIEAVQGGADPATVGQATEPSGPAIEVGGVMNYVPIDPKTGKAAMDMKTKKPVKPIEIEILTVDEAKQTVTAKSNVDKKPILDPKTKKARQIPFGELLPPTV